jgi:GT2 family glycosyltransferase
VSGAGGNAARGAVAIVVTYNRADVLRDTLMAVRRQEWPPAGVIVVDNCSQDRTASMIKMEFSDMTYCRLNENLGFGAGLAAGIAEAQHRGFSYFWLLDDDSRPASTALKRCLEVAETIPHLGILGLSGGVLRHGMLKHDSQVRARDGRRSHAPRIRTSDFVLLDGALVARPAVEHVGYPRADFFMMLEDVEYTTRLKRAGWEVAQLDEDLIERGHLGSGSNGRPGPPWRGYYQARNHLVMALDHRSISEVLGWLIRQAKFLGAIVLLLDRKGERVRLRFLGAWHALRGVRGKTIEPSP